MPCISLNLSLPTLPAILISAGVSITIPPISEIDLCCTFKIPQITPSISLADLGIPPTTLMPIIIAINTAIAAAQATLNQLSVSCPLD